MNKIKFLVIGIFSVFMFSFISCENNNGWYPTGTVVISSFSEYTDGVGDKICTVFYSIENTGNSRISLNTVSFKILTDSDEYYITKVSETTILPGKKIWESIAITYFDPLEVTALDRITIEGSFYE